MRVGGMRHVLQLLFACKWLSIEILWGMLPTGATAAGGRHPARAAAAMDDKFVVGSRCLSTIVAGAEL